MYLNMCWSLQFPFCILVTIIFFQVSKRLACPEKFLDPRPEPLTKRLGLHRRQTSHNAARRLQSSARASVLPAAPYFGERETESVLLLINP